MAGRGLAVAIVLAVLLIAIGLCVVFPVRTRPGLVLAAVLSLVLWVVAEDWTRGFDTVMARRPIPA